SPSCSTMTRPRVSPSRRTSRRRASVSFVTIPIMTGMTDSTGTPIPEGLRPALAELEAYLVGEPEERLSTHVLVLASTWVLGDAGLALDRYYAEAKTFYEITPGHDRVLTSFPDAMGFYISLRLTMNEAGEVEPERARAHLDAARAALEERAQLVEADYPLIAAGFWHLLEGTKDGSPPEGRLLPAVAPRVRGPYLPRSLPRAAPRAHA